MTQLPALYPGSPLAMILADIHKSIEAKLYYPALLVSLTIPEICVSLTLDTKVFVKEKHYVDFVDKYTTPEELGLSGIQCYRLRGGVVHRGNMAGHPFFDATHVVFSLPETTRRAHALTLEVGSSRAAMFDLLSFCNRMDAAARQWYDDHKDDAAVAANMKNLLRFIPDATIPILGRMGPIVASGPS